MITKFSEFDLRAAVEELKPARVFLRRRDPKLREVLKKLLPDGAYTLVEIADAPLLLREVSAQLLTWTPGETLEVTVAKPLDSEESARDFLVGFRRPAWKRGAILVTALAQTRMGDEEEYGSALILGPGESVSLVPENDSEPAPSRVRVPLKLAS